MNYKVCFVELKSNHTGRHYQFKMLLSEKEIKDIETGDSFDAFERIHAEAQITHKQDAYTIINIFVQCERSIYRV